MPLSEQLSNVAGNLSHLPVAFIDRPQDSMHDAPTRHKEAHDQRHFVENTAMLCLDRHPHSRPGILGRPPRRADGAVLRRTLGRGDQCPGQRTRDHGGAGTVGFDVERHDRHSRARRERCGARQRDRQGIRGLLHAAWHSWRPRIQGHAVAGRVVDCRYVHAGRPGHSVRAETTSSRHPPPHQRQRRRLPGSTSSCSPR